jgi:hypothetical protein
MLYSVIDSTAVVVVRAPSDRVTIACGGVQMVDTKPESRAAAPTLGDQGGTMIGKRYASEELELELLCTQAGAGTLAANGQPLELKRAKQLPSSD